MIIHPDGRLEGTPEELMQYKEAQAAKQQKDWWKQQGTGWPTWPIGLPHTTCEQYTYKTYTYK